MFLQSSISANGKKIDTRAPLEAVTESSLDLSREIQQIAITPQAYLRGTLSGVTHMTWAGD